jgi:hypothetical protein
MNDMNEMITRLLNWCYEHDYEILIYTNLTDKSFPHVIVTLSRNGYNAQHIFCLNGLSKNENENVYPSTKWFDNGLDFELRSFLEFAEDQFSRHEAEADNNG